MLEAKFGDNPLYIPFAMSPLKKLSDIKNLKICDSCVFFEISPKIAILLRFIFDKY